MATDPIFEHRHGPGIDYVTSGDEQTRTCRGCGKSETVKASGKQGKRYVFEGWMQFEREHRDCPRKEASR